MSKLISLNDAVDLVRDGDTIMVGGFLAVGTPERLIDALIEKGIKNLTLICNDTGFIDRGVGKMVVAKMFKKIMTSHIGTNRESGRQMLEGETEIVLIPQGTLIEQIRAGGFGLGGILTKTGLGTEVEKGKQVIEIDGERYLLEKPLRANVSLIFAEKADEKGNLTYHGATRNFNPCMAAAADIVIAEAQQVVKVGEICPDDVVVPFIFIDHIVDGGAL